MSRFKLSIRKYGDIFLHTTKVENLFINEFLPEAPGEYVKVYLFGLMYAQYGQEMDPQKLSRILGLSPEDLDEAWIYWESKGLIKIRNESGGEGPLKRIVFLSQIEELYGKAEESPATVSAADAPAAEIPIGLSIDDTDFDKVFESRAVDGRLRDIYGRYQDVTGRTISRRETGRIEDAVRVYGVAPEIFEYAIDYCADLEKYSIDYIYKVAIRWNEEGCSSVDDVKKLLEKHSLRSSLYTRVFKAMGWNRLPAPADREMMDRWFDELKFTIDEVIDACNASAGIREPSLRYVNKVLENRQMKKGGIDPGTEKGEASGRPAENSAAEQSPVSRKVLADYYSYLRSEGEKEQKRRIDEVSAKIPGMSGLLETENSLNSQLLLTKPGGAGANQRQLLKTKKYSIEADRMNLLVSNGYPADYMNRRYKCDRCGDTGYTDDGMVCSCARERAREAFVWTGERKPD